ncbi:MAG: DUF2269 domain-containing protein [Gammaproteobacteria bacterium]|nr:DUF2269 domain-containing protein [Gammaproteobacteria bacterium]
MLKALHVLGAVVFLGNIIVTALWKGLADRTRNPVIVAFGQRLVMVTDIAFTATGAALLAITGTAMAGDYDHTDWLDLGIMLFVGSGVIWLAILISVEILQARMARIFRSGGEIPPRYWRLNILWMVFGTIAVILPLINVYLMVAKPAY